VCLCERLKAYYNQSGSRVSAGKDAAAKEAIASGELEPEKI